MLDNPTSLNILKIKYGDWLELDKEFKLINGSMYSRLLFIYNSNSFIMLF